MMCMITSLKNGLGKLPWTSFIPNLDTETRMLGSDVPCVATNSHAVFGAMDEPLASCVVVKF